ncbi:MAG: primosomal protein N' [Prevotella sp.]|nr:primosomal protein N' [Prevotella sp.]
MKYVDVILPLPLEGLFTYGIPAHLQAQMKFGVRVVVPLGKSKSYTALAVRVHDEQPTFDVKDIREVLDDAPMLLPEQLRLWNWIADYYLSPIGEIYKAALPSGLKSEDGYRPKTEACVMLAEKYCNERALHVALDMLRTAKKQREALERGLPLLLPGVFGALSDGKGGQMATAGGGKCPSEGGVPAAGHVDNGLLLESAAVTREEFMNATHCTAAILKALIDRGILGTFQREVGRLNTGKEPHPENIKPLNAVQTDAYNGILFQFMKRNVVLLHGVTSSGKTEIYIHLIQKAIDEGRQVLYLLPEIALTVQMMERLQRVFGRRLGIYHSKYSDAERVEIWQKQLSRNPYDVILGARSACLLPFQRLGLVIVDEEHETSFKQQDPAPRYHARSVAIMLAQMAGRMGRDKGPGASVGGGEAERNDGVKVLLGTATPSMESYYNAQEGGKYGLVTLSERYKGIQLPEIQVVDIKDLQRRKMMNGPFSPVLLAAVKKALDAGEQAILFQNRRGFAPMIECKTCGWVPKCQNCDVSLTLHKNTNVLTCHYCGLTYTIPQRCPNCESTELRGRGYGTEKIEDRIQEIFPEARIARMDLDTTRTRSAYERIIGDFSAGRTNLLIGTQMVSKGLDFDRVSVVGILNADTMLNYPDFRSYEHAFMMMAQVSGRAGRKEKRGLVVLQTKSPELPVIRQVVANDYTGFYRELLEERRTFHYPPFYHLIYVYLKHRKDEIVNTAGYEMGSRLRELFGDRVLGPDKPAVARVKQLNIRKIVLKLENGISQKRVRECLRQVQALLMEDARYAALQVYYDVDPL